MPMPEHSPLGASSAERWINCPGSVSLIRALAAAEHAIGEQEEPGFRLEGQQAHGVAADCLNGELDAWEADPSKYSMLSPDMMRAVQVHLDYVRSLRGWKFVELRMHRPEFHELAYGTTDVACLDPGYIEIIDYKHGAGLLVEVEENPQLMYYVGLVIDELGGAWSDDEEIKITVVQPRIKWHPDGVIRSWVTTVGHIRRWMVETLRPAMVRTSVDAYLDPGQHCRFCPAHLVCPAMLAVGSEFSHLDAAELQALSDPALARLLTRVPMLKMLIPGLIKEARRRLIHNRGTLEGWKVVPALTDRRWKEDAPTFGYQPAKQLTPAQVEDMPGGKEFVAQWAEKAFAGYDIVPEADRRKPVKLETGAEKWATFMENINT